MPKSKLEKWAIILLFLPVLGPLVPVIMNGLVGHLRQEENLKKVNNFISLYGDKILKDNKISFKYMLLLAEMECWV